MNTSEIEKKTKKEKTMILVFDTETTGMVDFKKLESDPCQPRLVQFAGMVVDGERVVKSVSSIVHPGINIPSDVSKIHGITDELVDRVGIDMYEILKWYSDEVRRCSFIVAHNANFDIRVMNSQFYYKKCIPPKIPEVYDTMEKSTNLLKMKGPYGYKWPKLIELHKFLFNEGFDGAHDAMEDVRATFRCYKKLVEMGIK